MKFDTRHGPVHGDSATFQRLSATPLGEEGVRHLIDMHFSGRWPTPGPLDTYTEGPKPPGASLGYICGTHFCIYTTGTFGVTTISLVANKANYEWLKENLVVIHDLSQEQRSLLA